MAENKINQTGSGNVAISDVHDSEISIVIGKSPQYNELIDQLRTEEKLFARTPEAETQERLEISRKIDELKQSIKQFKYDVLQDCRVHRPVKGFSHLHVGANLQRSCSFPFIVAFS